jgi:hypothetical protein
MVKKTKAEYDTTYVRGLNFESKMLEGGSVLLFKDAF